MAKAITFKKFLHFIEKYKIEREKLLTDESIDHIKNYAEKGFEGYHFLDIRKTAKNMSRLLPTTKLESNTILYDYEKLLSKKKTYVFIDDHATIAPLICEILAKFGYKSYYLKKGFTGFSSWYKDTKSKN